MVGHYVAEYNALIKRLETLGIDENPDGIFKYLFGRESKFIAVMMQRLDLTHEECYQFLATTYFAAEFGETPKHLEDHR